jgi:metal-sulfur cluster biosynthetic enzyme
MRGASIDEMHQEALNVLDQVYDGCCVERQISIVEMGLVDELVIDAGLARLRLVLTTGWCPFSSGMIADAERRLLSVPGIDAVDIDVRWDKVWDRSRMAPGLADRFRLLPEPDAASKRDFLLTATRTKVWR